MPEQFQPGRDEKPSYTAFKPNQTDADGLSFWRESLTAPRDAAAGRNPARKNYLARIAVRDLIALGVILEIDSNDPRHVLAVNINSGNRTHKAQSEWQVAMATHSAIIDPYEDER